MSAGNAGNVNFTAFLRFSSEAATAPATIIYEGDVLASGRRQTTGSGPFIGRTGQMERHAAWRDDQPNTHRVKSYEVTIAAPPEALAQADRALARAGIRGRLTLVSGLGGDDPKAEAIVVGIVGEGESDAEQAVRNALPAVCRYTLTVAVGPARWRSSCPARPPPRPSTEKALWSKDPGSGRF